MKRNWDIIRDVLIEVEALEVVLADAAKADGFGGAGGGHGGDTDGALQRKFNRSPEIPANARA